MVLQVHFLQQQSKLDQLEQLFHSVFWQSYKTRLIGGAPEPEYIPPRAKDDHALPRIFASDPALANHLETCASIPEKSAQILYKDDHLASALHEIAHWCIAGPKRLALHDYGYWYAPDGRSREQQIEFEQVEVKPQAIEWLFSVAAAEPFYLSADNLDAQCAPSERFKASVVAQAQQYCLNPADLPKRAKVFADALTQLFRADGFELYSINHFQESAL